MKNLLFLIAFLFTTALSFAQVSVSGYYRSNSTYVKPHQRTAPNYTRNDNYSTIGNTNPYTGKAGTVARDGYNATQTSYSSYYTPTSTYSSSYSTPSSSTKQTYTGSQGGTYYINSNGNKTYVH